MKPKTFLRALFQILVFGIFIFQMKNSVGKYLESPVNQIPSATTLDAIKMPVIWIIQGKLVKFKGVFKIG